jgi:hypothetical protein
VPQLAHGTYQRGGFKPKIRPSGNGSGAMTIALQNPERPEHSGPRTWLLPAAFAGLYPLLLRSAYGSVALLGQSRTFANEVGVVLAIAAAIVAAFAVPVSAGVTAFCVVADGHATTSSRLALRILHVAFAAPPLFTALGVLTTIFGVGDLDVAIWLVCWSALIAASLRAGARGTAIAVTEAPPGAVRVAHGLLALSVLLIFLIAHVANHTFAIWTPAFHDDVMRILEKIYRARFIEPVLVGMFLLLMASGLGMAWRYLSLPQDPFRTLQTLSGFYLAFFIISHLTAVFVYARMVLHVRTDWSFATGGTTGVIRDAWNERLIPHYGIAVWAVFTHVELGVRNVARAHGLAPAADKVVWCMSGLGAVVSAVITLAILGVHLGKW